MSLCMLSSCFRRSSLRLFSRSLSSPHVPVDLHTANFTTDAEESTLRARNVGDGESSMLHLPPEDQWRKIFPLTSLVSHRTSLKNQDTANAIADAFVPKGSRDKVIIEAYPGNPMWVWIIAVEKNAFRSWSAHKGIVEFTEGTGQEANCYGGRQNLPVVSSRTRHVYRSLTFLMLFTASRGRRSQSKDSTRGGLRLELVYVT